MADLDLKLLVLPEEVMYGSVFPYLELNELLRLRRVCTKTKAYSDGYIRNHFNNHEREINETDHSFAEFIRRDLPTSKVYLNNTGPEFFKDSNIPKFLQLYADKITHLRVQYFSTCNTEPENAFFSALTNLQHLEIHFADASGRECKHPYQIINYYKIRFSCTTSFPQNFVNLKTLKFHNFKRRYYHTSTNGLQYYCYCYYKDIVYFCSNLEHLKHPKFLNLRDATDLGCDYRLAEPFQDVVNCIVERRAKDHNISLALKEIDLEYHCHNERVPDSIGYYFLNEKCYNNNIKSMNVDGNLLEMFTRDEFNEVSETLVSVRNCIGLMFFGELANLEKMLITSTLKCTYHQYEEEWNGNQPKWPNLTELDINISSIKTKGSSHFHSVPVQKLLHFLFVAVERPKLKKLSIRFGRSKTINKESVPRAVDIVANCSNLTSLTLQNWMGSNEALLQFWNGLPLLEDVTLDACKMLEDAAFMGRNQEESSFLKLSRLRKFSLIKLDQMPEMTDLVFILVFRNLKIKEFYLTSGHPIESVTIRGIQALSTGTFNNYVEKFPFRYWSLKNVSRQKFTNLKKEFRASFML